MRRATQGGRPDAQYVEVMGVPVLIEGPPALLDAARRSLDLPPGRPSPSEAPPVGVLLSRQAEGARAGPGSADRARAHIDVSGDRLRLRCDGVSGVADAGRGRARVRIADRVLANEAFLGRDVLDTLLLFLVTARDRQPVHAAGVVVEGRALVLAGRSGAGKSTLAFASQRAGLAVLADDAVHLQSRQGLRVWGMQRPLALPADAAERFPELGSLAPIRRPDGRDKILVPLTASPLGRLCGVAPMGLCLLDRTGQGVGAVERLDAEAAAGELLSSLEPGFDRFAHTLRRPLVALARRGAWRVALPAEPAAAVALLLSLPRDR